MAILEEVQLHSDTIFDKGQWSATIFIASVVGTTDPVVQENWIEKNTKN